MAEQTPDVEALAHVILPVLPNHCCEPGDVTDCPYDAHDASSIAQAILDSDWLAARDQAAERRGAVTALREVRRLVVRCYPRSLVSTRTVIADLDEAIERTDRIEAGS